MAHRLKLTKKVTGNNLFLRFEGELTVYTPAKFLQAMEGFLDSYSVIECDLSGLENFDSAGFQAIEAVKREAIKNEIDFRIKNFSEVVRSLYSLYGEKL